MIELMQRAAREGGEILMKYQGTTLEKVHKSGSRDIVTKADIESQQAITSYILAHTDLSGFSPEQIGFIGEEQLQRSGKVRFIIDPLDGTSNFASGIDYFCVMIGFVGQNGTVDAGVIHEPFRDYTYAAERGKGAFKRTKNGTKTPLTITYQQLEDIIVDVHYSSNVDNSIESFEKYKKMLPHIHKLRSFGTIGLGLAFVADGRFGALINTSCKIWDIAPAIPIIEEAGGVITDLAGNPLQLDFEDRTKSYKVIAAHPKNISEIVHILSR